MNSEITVALSPSHQSTRLLAVRRGQEILRAELGPPSQMHAHAAPRLLEGLALWFQHPLRVVLCVDELSTGFDLSLEDGFGLGDKRLHYEVEVATRQTDRRRSLRMPGCRCPPETAQI
jgi:hypothetical protein